MPLMRKIPFVLDSFFSPFSRPYYLEKYLPRQFPSLLDIAYSLPISTEINHPSSIHFIFDDRNLLVMDNIRKPIIDKNVEGFHVHKIKKGISQFLYVFIHSY